MGDGPIRETSKTALIAEDDFFVAMNLETMIKERGWQVLGPFSTIAETLAAVSDGASVDTAFVDVHLSGEKAWPAIDALSAKGIRVVLTTGYGASSLPEAYRTLPRLDKPFTTEMLESLLAGEIPAT